MRPEDKIVSFDKIVKVIEREETDMPEPSLNVIEEHRKYCAHEHVNLFVHHRILVCRDCDATIDPYDFVFKLAREGNNHISTIKWLRYELKNIQKQKEELEKDIRNLKAQKRRVS